MTISTVLGLAELLGKLELWKNLFDKGVDSSKVPMVPSLQQKIAILSTMWRELFDHVKDTEIMLKTTQEFTISVRIYNTLLIKPYCLSITNILNISVLEHHIHDSSNRIVNHQLVAILFYLVSF